MKLHPDKLEGLVITGLGPGWIGINGEQKQHSLVLNSRGECHDWRCQRFEDLTSAHFAQLALLDCDTVIFGAGTRMRFPAVQWLKPLIDKGIGLESMDTAAACRTYNILANEGRRVVAALILETNP